MRLAKGEDRPTMRFEAIESSAGMRIIYMGGSHCYLPPLSDSHSCADRQPTPLFQPLARRLRGLFSGDPGSQVRQRVLEGGPIPLYHWSGSPNLGDSIARVLVEGLSGRPTIIVGKREGPRLLACGSILGRARRGDIIWGAGSLRPDHLPHSRRIEVRAVRGPLTRSLLQKEGIACPEIFGDPALLLPLVMPRPPEITSRFRVGIVAHYVDKPEVGKRLGASSADPSIAQLDIQGGLEPFLTTLWQCERIVSTSLHGVIFAEAYGIPAREWRLTDEAGRDRVRGASHKFEDYYLGTGRERPEPLTGEAWDEVDEAPPPRIDPGLLPSFPFLRSEPDGGGGVLS